MSVGSKCQHATATATNRWYRSPEHSEVGVYTRCATGQQVNLNKFDAHATLSVTVRPGPISASSRFADSSLPWYVTGAQAGVISKFDSGIVLRVPASVV